MFNRVVDRRSKETRLNEVFRALADPSRRRIVELLRESGELKVSDIASAFSMSLNGVSKHLKTLEKAGVIRRRVDGREHWLAIDWAALQAPYEWLHFYRQFWDARLDALVDYVRENDDAKEKRK